MSAGSIPARLSAAALAGLPRDVAVPRYDRAALKTGIVHLGVGAFHRAHQAHYTEAALAAGDLSWGISAASLRSPETRDALNPQDGLYSLAARDESGERLRIIGAIRDVLVAPENPAALISAMFHADVKIVSLTVTEKGYCHDPARNVLNEDDANIRHDLAHPRAPVTAIGFLAAALAARRAAGLKPFTILCCDNLPANGVTVKRVLTRFAELRDRDFGRWVADNAACPATMVDRIVPATSDEDRARIAARLGVADAWPVMTEPFTQWVIEDNFPQGRPDWTLAGAQFVRDVAPYETMKLRLLNGAHSAIAYLGYLSGYETVAEAMEDAPLVHLVTALMDDAAQTLELPAGADVGAYKSALIARFRNPALRHRTWQIAMDGSQKIPQRWLAAVRARLGAGKSIEAYALPLAGWMVYVAGRDEKGAAIDVRDPLRDELRRRADSAGRDAGALARALLGVEAVFGSDLPADPRFTAPVVSALKSLLQFGARETLRRRADSAA